MTTHPPALAGKVVVITGGGGFLGRAHAVAVVAAGGIPVLADIDTSAAERVAGAIGAPAEARFVDITDEASVERLLQGLVAQFGRVDVLVNNAARNPKVEDASSVAFSRLETFPLEQWNMDLAVTLTGAFICAKVFGRHFAERRTGSIINISSEYGMLAPDQRLYHVPGAPSEQQPVKPVSYTVAKAGLHGLTIYLATYWADRGVRANTLTIGGVENGQPAEFVERATQRIPIGRMAQPSDFAGALVLLCSDASAFMTGANVVVDGGKSVW
jgi:NAD(P)-dependent dehydrogenase (short-subunit alcohol dehydrogenase family)